MKREKAIIICLGVSAILVGLFVLFVSRGSDIRQKTVIMETCNDNVITNEVVTSISDSDFSKDFCKQVERLIPPMKNADKLVYNERNILYLLSLTDPIGEKRLHEFYTNFLRGIQTYAKWDTTGISQKCITKWNIQNGGTNPAKLNSWLYEDFCMYHYFFKGIGKTGIYLDIGANDPVEHSNTYFFDNCLGWKGICVEGHPKNVELWKNSDRKCKLVGTCAMHKDGWFKMSYKHGGDPSFQGELSEVDATEVAPNTPEAINCMSINNIIEKNLDALGGDYKVDLFSLDIEGSEEIALTTFDFEKYEPLLMVVETFHAKQSLTDLILSKGYIAMKKFDNYDQYNTWFVKKPKCLL